MTIQLNWSQIWTEIFAGMDSPTKTKFLREVEIVKLVSQASDKLQIEILENAPVELVEYLQEHLRPAAKLKLIKPTQQQQQISPKTQPIKKQTSQSRVYQNIINRMSR